MTLQVWTARITYAGPDALDVTRATAHNVGLVMNRDVPGAIFAPSWSIVNRIQREFEMADRERAYGRAQRADHIVQASWIAYARKYTVEMRLSYKQHRTGWDALLKRETVTLCCFCVEQAYCHRTLLAAILGKLGAQIMGERSAEEQVRK